MLATYADLKKAFDTVSGDALHNVLQLRRILATSLGVLTGLYSGKASALNCAGGCQASSCEKRSAAGVHPRPNTFQRLYGSSIRQGCRPSCCRTSTGNSKVTDLVFVDDAITSAELLEVLLLAFKALCKEK